MTSTLTTDVAVIDETLVEEAARAAGAGRVFRRVLPGNGRLVLEERHPFLCLYRRPAGRDDPGTPQLLLGQAAFLEASGSEVHKPFLTRLIARLADELVGIFDAFLMLEIWSARAGSLLPLEGVAPPPRFRIVAADRHAPTELIEVLEKALLSAFGDHEGVEITIDYRPAIAPPGQDALLPTTGVEPQSVTCLGLEVAAIYRDPDSDLIRPLVLKAMKQRLGKALKQTFYHFCHTRSVRRPAHYHELGRTEITQDIDKVDRCLADIGEAFDLLLHATPVNTASAWHAFRQRRFDQAPEFHYRAQVVDVGTLKRRLFALPLEIVEDPALYDLLEEKRDEIDRQLSMLGDRDTRRFLHGSQLLFGSPDMPLVALARRLLDDLQPKPAEGGEADWLDARTFAKQAEAELDHYRRQCPDLPAAVEVRDDVPGLVVSKGRLLIGTDATVNKHRMAATLHHEIGTHVLTYVNGLHQPFKQMHGGMAGYEELQEGLAVLAEFLVGGLDAARLRLLAGRVLAVDSMVGGADFIETFRLLRHDRGFAARAAFVMAMRVHRGGGFTKDMVYLRGLDRLLEHLRGGGTLDRLLVGKVALDHQDLLDELSRRGLVKPAVLSPRYLDDPAARRRLGEVERGLRVVDLIEAAPP